MKKIILTAVSLMLALSMLALSSCTTEGGGDDTDASETNSSGTTSSSGSSGDTTSDDDGNDDSTASSSRYTNFDLRTDYDEDEAVTVVFTDETITLSGDDTSGASVDGTTLTITAEGTYVISGSCSDGQIIVEVSDTEKVQLVFNGISLMCKTSAPVWVKCADKTSITLADGTTNTMQDAASYTDVNTDGEPNACIFSKDDLTINGTGTLNVYANCNNGITSKDDLKIISGIITVTAENHGIRGNDSVTIKDGTISVSCGNDGIKASNTTKSDKGYIYIEGGTITIDCGDDALQAITSIDVTGGSITVSAAGDVTNCEGTVNLADGCVTEQ